MHLGLIGGIGPAATEFYYRGLVARHAGQAEAMQLTIVHADARQVSRNAANGDAQAQAEIFCGFVDRLKAAGAEAVAITSIGGHFCVRELEAISPLPILNAIPAIAARVQQEGFKTVGLIGTTRVMNTRLYNGISSARVVVPEGAALGQTGDTYIAMALSGTVTEQQRKDLFAVGRQMREKQGADVILLAGTDLFLAFDGHDCGFPTLDCADIHMDVLHKAQVRKA
jgi:aspartate racemase